MHMTVELPIEQTTHVAARPRLAWPSRYARPLLGVILPVGLAALW
jgi:hypothetical protein